MTTSNRLGITELAETQNSRHVTVNEAIAILEAFAGFIQAKSVGDNAPPGSPAEGDIYVVGTAGTGAFSGHNEAVALYSNASWIFISPIEGFLAFAQDDNAYYRYDGADWIAETFGTSPIGKHTIWVPATAMMARSTNGAAQGTAEMSSNKNMVKTLDFDASTQEFAQFDVAMPKSYNGGTITFIPYWSHAATLTNFGVAWGVDAVAISDDDTLDVAFGTSVVVTDTGGTTNDLYVGAESGAITIAGSPATGDLIQFRIHRDPANGSDTLAVDARLHGVRVIFTTNAANDN
ncbi:MAG: DUF2793 domain-containing protein [Mesorhizobium sp.]|nr:MAG: DUF2793 domain-containing protein [Mesorhizobium sp.]